MITFPTPKVCFRLAGFILFYFLTDAHILAQTKMWQTTIPDGGCFSSINASADLNLDGVDDLVIGGGKEAVKSDFGVIALDGKTGQIIWRIPCRSQMYGSARFLYANSDKIPDVLMCGRDAQLFMIDGSNGKLIWQFWPDSLGNAADSGWYNFYTPTLTEDLDADGAVDFVITNGGKAAASAGDTIRPAGILLLMSGKTGQIISKIEMPDGRETYFSPIFNPATEGEIIFGSGGETIGGGLWRIHLTDLQNQKTENIKSILTEKNHGFIALPSFSKDTLTGIYRMYVPVYDSKIHCLNALTYASLWAYSVAGTEAYVSPSTGNFNGDDVLDVFTIFAHGIYPFYTNYTMVVLDGKDGSEIKKWNNGGIYQLTSANVVDIDFDGIDELLFAKNFDAGSSEVQYRNQFQVTDLNNDTTYNWLGIRKGMVLYAMPALCDLENNQKTDIIFVTNTNEENWYLHDSFIVERHQFPKLMPSNWPCYSGTFSRLESKPLGIQSKPLSYSQIKLAPNPAFEGHVTLLGDIELIEWKLLDYFGREISCGNNKNIELPHLSSALYFINVVSNQGQHSLKLWIP